MQARKTETKTRKRFVKRVAVRHKEKGGGSGGGMAAQLALQRNFVTITPSNQITSTTAQTTNQSTTAAMATTAAASSATNGDIVTITDTNQISPSETNSAPIHIMQTHTQVINKWLKQIQIIAQKARSRIVHGKFHFNRINPFFGSEKIYLTNGHHIGWCFNY